MARDATGREFPAEIAIAPLTHEHLSFCAFIRDISDMKLAERRREEINIQLREISRQASRRSGASANAAELEALIADRVNLMKAEREQDKMRVHALEEAIRNLTAQLVQVCGGNVASLDTENKSDRYSPSSPPFPGT